MDYKYIEQLLERYWHCETSLEEEQILRSFFSQKDIPAELFKYKDLFAYESLETETDVLGADFDARIMSVVNEADPVKARTISMRSRFVPLFKAAAVVAVFIMLGNLSQTVLTSGDNIYNGVHSGKNISVGSNVAMNDSLASDSLDKVAASAEVLE